MARGVELDRGVLERLRPPLEERTGLPRRHPADIDARDVDAACQALGGAGERQADDDPRQRREHGENRRAAGEHGLPGARLSPARPDQT
jgi:hypothetical protein